ncbi:hypothetical protein BE221DRAFT_189560 [Ostreococcus tauri]|uniref:TatD family n=1 Tax=Ostreococcus tauri TaxID=70448 RepID=A0A1Y5IMJ4_OSTTA|nr:hypothetical protein BE221DRAFT_189560 [Ostreococcus tauri]
MPGAEFVDVGVNALDSMFDGVYRGKRAHEGDIARVLRRARSSGVRSIVVTAGTLEESRAAVALARGREKEGGEEPRVFATCGTHPTRCGEFLSHEDGGADGYMRALMTIAMDGKRTGDVVAIGELGLDYDRLEFCDAETQRMFFEKQFALSEATGLPLFLHMRAACDDFMTIVERNRHRFTAGVVHSFTGTAEEARRILACDGLYIGLNGCSLKTEENLEVVRTIPLDRVVIETDAPWCGIKPTHAGHAFTTPLAEWSPPTKKEKYNPDRFVKDRCEPAQIVYVAQIIARVTSRAVEDVARVTSANAARVFGV